jgi:putative hydrolase of the HAD superfamily
VSRERSIIQAVFFDLDDTLYPERQFIRSGYRAAAEKLRKDYSRHETFEDWLWERFLAGRSDRAFDALNDHFHLNLNEWRIARLVEAYRFHFPDDIAPFAGVWELLSRLDRSCRLGLITDGPARMQQNKIDALGLSDILEESLILLTDTLGPDCAKPNPAAFLLAAERLAMPPEALAYVADNPAKDFIAPNALGWLTIQYLREGQIHVHKPAPPAGEPKVIVHSDEELLNVLDAA